MPIVHDSLFHIIAYLVISVLCAYGGGRAHQWYRHGMDRDRSFREGFNHGYQALFPLAARGTRPTAGPDDRKNRCGSEPSIRPRQREVEVSGGEG